MKKNTIKIILALAAVYIIWGSTYLAIRIAVETMPPLIMSGSRFLLAGTIMYIAMLLRGVKNPPINLWKNAAITGSLMMLGGTGLVSLAEKQISSSLAAIAVTTLPLWACLFSGFTGNWPRKIEWVGLLLGLCGIVLINMDKGIQTSLIGAIVLFLAPMLWALGSIISKNIKLPDGLMATAIQMITGGAASCIVGLLLGEPAVFSAHPDSLLAYVFLIIFGSIIGFSAYMYLLNNVRPALATSYAFVNPIIAVLLGIFLYGEKLAWQGTLALIIVTVGVIFVALGSSKKIATTQH